MIYILQSVDVYTPRGGLGTLVLVPVAISVIPVEEWTHFFRFGSVVLYRNDRRLFNNGPGDFAPKVGDTL